MKALIFQSKISLKNEDITMHPSKHATKRLRQRGFRENDLPLLVEFARFEKAPAGVEVAIFGNKEYQEAVSFFKYMIQKAEHLKGANLIISERSTIVTAYKNKKRKRKLI
jgi:hypothetical protein